MDPLEEEIPSEEEDFSLELEDNINREDVNRSPSPVILWRSSARVKIATDIPRDLRSVLMGDKDVKEAERKKEDTRTADRETTDSNRPHPIQSRVPRQKTRSKKPVSKNLKQSEAKSPKPKPKKQYGAWYIPRSKWQHLYKNSDVESEFLHGKKTQYDSDLEERSKQVAEELPDLFSAKAYKAFIMNHKVNNNMPHYLENVSIESTTTK